MATGYSRTVQFAGVSGIATCVELPAAPRGVLERLIITQLTGTAAGGSVSVFDRKGACANANDLNVEEAGGVTSIADSGGSASITFDAAHNLQVGDQIEIKGSSVSAYNTTHTVASVTSDTVAVTDVAFTSGATGGLWQTLPFLPTANPASHLVYSGSVSSGSLQAFDIDRGYENRDNQSETKRTRSSALWLEYTPNQNGTFEVAITTESDGII
jgi:hypothetical protein